jgi:hypothetical protein
MPDPTDPIHITKDMVGDLIATMPDNAGLRFIKDENHDTRIGLVKLHELADLSQDTSKLFVVSMMMRTGAEYFFNHLEYTYFPPLTPENDEYDYLTFKWSGILWSICSIPIEKREFAENSAEEAKMKLANGVPFMIGPEACRGIGATRPDHFEGLGITEELSKEMSTNWFPLNGETVFTLENTKKGDVNVYDGKGAEQDLQAEYDYKLRQLHDKHHPEPPE